MPGSDDSRVDMTTGSITPRLFRLAWPLVVGNLLQTLYNLADMFWVGRVSTDAVAAVALMFPLSWLFVSTAMGLSAATIALVSQHVGAGNDRRADAFVAQTMLLAAAVATALAVVGFAARREILYWMGARGAVGVEALAYIEIILLALPFTFLFIGFRAALQGAGDTKTAMWLVAISAGVNVLIDPVLILDWGPFLGWGTRGAGWATFVARLIATAAGIAILVRGDWGVQLHLGDLRPDPALLRQLVDVGYPSTLDGWARSFAAVAMASLVARFGPAAVAAYGIGVRYMSVTWTVAGAVGQATATGVGQNLGAETPDRAAAVTYRASAATMAALAAAGAVAWLVPATAIGLFDDSPDVVAEGVTFLRIVAIAWPFFGGLMVIQGAFRGAGSTRIAMALSMLSRWLFRVPLAVVLAFTWVVSVPGAELTLRGIGWGPRDSGGATRSAPSRRSSSAWRGSCAGPGRRASSSARGERRRAATRRTTSRQPVHRSDRRARRIWTTASTGRKEQHGSVTICLIVASGIGPSRAPASPGEWSKEYFSQRPVPVES